MKELIIKTQKELGKIKPDFEGTIYIEGGTQGSPLTLSIKYDQAEVIVRGQAVIIMRGNSIVQDMWDNSIVQDMRGNSIVQDMWDNSIVQDMRGNSIVQDMRGNSIVQDMRDNSIVQDMRGNSIVQRMRENSIVQDMRGNSIVQALYGEAMVSCYGNNSVVSHGYNIIRTTQKNEKNLTLVLCKNSHLIVIPDFEPTFEEYQKRYPVEIKGDKAIFYKAVHKKDDKYFSDNDKSFEYKIGETITHKNDLSTDNSCSFGLHIACKDWAIMYGKTWNDFALLECEIPIESIVVSKDCDGKVRCGELTVIKEIKI